MNLKRKNEMLERRISSLQKQVDRLTKDNEKLQSANAELSDEVARYEIQKQMIEELRQELADGISEVCTVREQYKLAAHEARKSQKEYTKKFKQLIKQLKTQV